MKDLSVTHEFQTNFFSTRFWLLQSVQNTFKFLKCLFIIFFSYSFFELINHEFFSNFKPSQLFLLIALVLNNIHDFHDKFYFLFIINLIFKPILIILYYVCVLFYFLLIRFNSFFFEEHQNVLSRFILNSLIEVSIVGDNLSVYINS